MTWLGPKDHVAVLDGIRGSNGRMEWWLRPGAAREEALRMTARRRVDRKVNGVSPFDLNSLGSQGRTCHPHPGGHLHSELQSNPGGMPSSRPLRGFQVG